jgi:hypothetical protein
MATTFKLGYRPSPAGWTGLGHPQHLAAAPVPTNVYVDLPPTLDQGNSSSCTGNSSAVAICAAMARAANLPAGQFPELPSRLFLYYGARWYIDETGQDDGAEIHSIFDGAAKLGVPRESEWPYSDALADVIRQPDFAAYHAAADQKIVQGVWKISSSGTARVDDVFRALGTGATVVWGTSLDNTVFDLQNDPEGVWPGVTGAIIGGHAMVLHAGEPWRPNERRLLSRTSWGPFAKDGSFWVSEHAVASSNASDFLVVQLAPAYLDSLKEAA